jgi:hypothetical protein
VFIPTVDAETSSRCAERCVLDVVDYTIIAGGNARSKQR